MIDNPPQRNLLHDGKHPITLDLLLVKNINLRNSHNHLLWLEMGSRNCSKAHAMESEVSWEKLWNSVEQSIRRLLQIQITRPSHWSFLWLDCLLLIIYNVSTTTTCESYVPNPVEGQRGTGEFFNCNSKYTMHFDSHKLWKAARTQKIFCNTFIW